MSQHPQPFKSVTSFMYFPFKHRVLNFTEPRLYARYKLDSHASLAKNMICLATEQVVEWPSLLCVYDFNPVFDTGFPRYLRGLSSLRIWNPRIPKLSI